MIWPSTRLLMLAVLNAVTDPSPVRYTGTSCRCTVATATDTGCGPLACALPCLEPAGLLLHPARVAHNTPMAKIARMRMSVLLAQFFFKIIRSFIFKESIQAYPLVNRGAARIHRRAASIRRIYC